MDHASQSGDGQGRQAPQSRGQPGGPALIPLRPGAPNAQGLSAAGTLASIHRRFRVVYGRGNAKGAL